MTAVSTARLDREQFVSWLADAMSGLPARPSRVSKRAEKSTDVTIVWSNEQSNAHPVICVPQDQFQELFAFVSTYTKLRPFTAFFRVVPLELIHVLDHKKNETDANFGLAKCVAGAAMAEAWFASFREAERPSNVFPLLLESLSAALGQAALAGYDDAAFEWVLTEWAGLMARKSDVVRVESLEGAVTAWRTFLPKAGYSPNNLGADEVVIADFLQEAIAGGTVHPRMLQRLETISGEVDLLALLAAPREDRIERFNSVIADFKRRNVRGFRAEFLAGLMLAIAGNGTFGMLRSAREFDGWLDGSVTWFGICAALFEESNVLSYANSAGRMLVRDLLRRSDPFAAPQADMGSGEFRFFESGDNFEQLASHSHLSLDVEILPNVISRVTAPTLGGGSLQREELEMMLRTLDEIGFLADRARRSLYNAEQGDRQGALFKPSRRVRGR